eukprot:2906573-Alexandrium_andersonii.AAC.1
MPGWQTRSHEPHRATRAQASCTAIHVHTHMVPEKLPDSFLRTPREFPESYPESLLRASQKAAVWFLWG